MKTTAAQPSVDAMWEWLGSPPVIAPTGEVLSWVNDRHLGYEYPEAAALLLRLVALFSPEASVFRSLLADGLVRRAIETGGAIGRGGQGYAFDTSMTLAALAAHQRANGATTCSPAMTALFCVIRQCVRSRRAVTIPERQPTGHWSLRYGCHLLKSIIALREYGCLDSSSNVSELIDQLLRDLLPLLDGGRFRIHCESPVTYLHSNCYAVEGLLALRTPRPLAVEAVLYKSARWLGEVQTECGGMHAWHDGAQSTGPLRADATAQAIRIWCCVGPSEFEYQIQRGLSFLAKLQAPGGGIYYEVGSRDVNTWATIFAIQACQWASRGAQPLQLV